MISQERAEKALAYLATTDEKVADAKVEVMKREYHSKLTRAQQFLGAEGSVEQRKAIAEVSQPVQDAEAESLKAVGVFEHLKAKRATEEWVMEMWRSLNANRRQGNIT